MSVVQNGPSLAQPADQWGEIRSLLIQNLQAVDAGSPILERTGVTPEYIVVSGQMDTALSKLRGLIYALSMLACSGDGLYKPADECAAVNTLADFLGEELDRADEIQKRLWLAAGGRE